jgi:GNAT superfamily N-acetyltransferase
MTKLENKSVQRQPLKTTVLPPPVYRPQGAAPFVQPKAISKSIWQPGTAPPVYRPQPPAIQHPGNLPLQTKEVNAKPAVAFTNYLVQAPMPQHGGVQQIRVALPGVGNVGSVRLNPSENGRVYISDLEVTPEHRRHGVGSMLVQAALRTAQSQGKSGAVLEAMPGTGSIAPQALVSMYQKLGFRQVGLSHRGRPLMEFGAGGIRQRPGSGPLQLKPANSVHWPGPSSIQRSAMENESKSEGRPKRSTAGQITKFVPAETVKSEMRDWALTNTGANKSDSIDVFCKILANQLAKDLKVTEGTVAVAILTNGSYVAARLQSSISAEQVATSVGNVQQAHHVDLTVAPTTTAPKTNLHAEMMIWLQHGANIMEVAASRPCCKLCAKFLESKGIKYPEIGDWPSNGWINPETNESYVA